MWSVRTIPPNNLVPTQLKVAAYCRVSTNSLEQQTSLSSQEQYYEEWIKRIPHWTFAGIYSDIGSGTQAKGRRRFNAMISACRRGKIDTILTKSAHRFARNTVDALETIRMLRRWKVDIEIAELEEKQRKSKTGKTSEKRAEDIRKKQERLAKINTVRRFTYNPNGDNVGYDSLNHSEVVKMGSKFICAEDTMQNILISQYPILLIDESQDTKKELVDAIFTVCERHKGKFIVGMFGDTMQRIYQDGKENLSQCIPDDWVKPQKIMNHRSASRIVTLANAIRFTVDTQQQRPRSDAEVGNVRLFIVSSDANKEVTEQRVAEIMSEETGDGEWRDSKQYKSLILEHHMAASRFGFLELYLPLNEVPVFNTSLRDGSISELSFLSKVISPLVQAYKGNNDFEVL